MLVEVLCLPKRDALAMHKEAHIHFVRVKRKIPEHLGYFLSQTVEGQAHTTSKDSRESCKTGPASRGHEAWTTQIDKLAGLVRA